MLQPKIILILWIRELSFPSRTAQMGTAWCKKWDPEWQPGRFPPVFSTVDPLLRISLWFSQFPSVGSYEVPGWLPMRNPSGYHMVRRVITRPITICSPNVSLITHSRMPTYVVHVRSLQIVIYRDLHSYSAFTHIHSSNQTLHKTPPNIYCTISSQIP